jgi:cell division septation protein DedD
MAYSFLRRPFRQFLLPTLGLAIAFSAPSASAQVSPAEILNPDLRALEESYFPQLKALNQSIAKLKFPFPFYLSRYVGINPAQQAESDSRGLEFVRFQDRVILKVSGNYNAAYDTARMTQNERAAATFRTVILPILNLMTSVLPQDLACDGIGFEISHHAHTRERAYDYEGKENLVVVLDRNDAWALSSATADSERQEILNRSKVFISGTDFGLSLAERDPLNVQALPRSIPGRPDATSSARSSTLVARSSLLKPNHPASPVSPAVAAPADPAPATANPAPASTTPVVALPKAADPPPAAPPASPANADRLNEKYQAQLAALAKEGAAKYHLVDYAPPAFMVFHDQIALQISLRNSLQFGPGKSSIYKRAAQSFDLFLAPQLKDLSDRISADVEFQFFDFSVMNKLAPGPKGASEAIEFICPRAALKQFVNAEITNQQLLDQSIILVNGVRIALNLQLVE